MSSRERLLALAVGGLLVLIVGFYLYGRIDDALRVRLAQNQRLNSQVMDLEKKVRKGQLSDRRLRELNDRSLPADRLLARSLYQSWLLELLGKVGLENPQVRATGGRAHGNVYYRLTFSVSGRGDLEQLVTLLHEFYSVNDLHQIRRLTVRPIPESRDLELGLAVEALVLPGSTRGEAVANLAAQRLTRGTFEEYRDAVLNRNLFAPPNKPPRLSSIGSKEVALGKSLSFTAKATDEDPLDSLAYRLGDDAPAGASISTSSGSFRWTPDKLGQFSLTIIATDDGMPPKSDNETIRVTVVEPPPPPPPEPEKVVQRPKLQFDDAKHAYVTAIMSDSAGRKQLWLTIRTSGEVLKLREGDRVDVGSIRGLIHRIGEKTVEFEVDEKLLLVSLGENLAEGTELPAEGL
jgi:hypothetical protein